MRVPVHAYSWLLTNMHAASMWLHISLNYYEIIVHHMLAEHMHDSES